MRMLFLIIITQTFGQSVSAQARDSAFYTRVDNRVEIMMDHFVHEVISDTSLVDTVFYVQHLLANQIEVCRLKTNRLSNLKPMYTYALKLRNQRFKSILSDKIWKAYTSSFVVEVGGFFFCRICDLAHLPEKDACGNCGEPYE